MKYTVESVNIVFLEDGPELTASVVMNDNGFSARRTFTLSGDGLSPEVEALITKALNAVTVSIGTPVDRRGNSSVGKAQ